MIWYGLSCVYLAVTPHLTFVLLPAMERRASLVLGSLCPRQASGLSFANAHWKHTDSWWLAFPVRCSSYDGGWMGLSSLPSCFEGSFCMVCFSGPRNWSWAMYAPGDPVPTSQMRGGDSPTKHRHVQDASLPVCPGKLLSRH